MPIPASIQACSENDLPGLMRFHMPHRRTTARAISANVFGRCGRIVSGCCNKATDHAVLIVGYGQGADSKGVQTPYWLIKNSWNIGSDCFLLSNMAIGKVLTRRK